jgi:hypothetical protein
LRGEDAITRTFDLAERILEAVAARQQDWHAIEELAVELAELASSKAAAKEPPDRPPRA